MTFRHLSAAWAHRIHLPTAPPQTTQASFLNPPPPPPSLIAVSSFCPTDVQLLAGALLVKVGEHYAEVNPRTNQMPSGTWLFVRRLGYGDVRGWIRPDMVAAFRSPHTTAIRGLNIDAEMKVVTATTSFRPLLAAWAVCEDVLSSIRGIWQDEGRRNPKIYTVTVFPERGEANVLSEMKNGACKNGRGLIQICKVANNSYSILWADSFCLNIDANSSKLQWLPTNEKKNSTWSWIRIL